MLPSIAARIAKEKAYNEKLTSNKKFAKKVSQKFSVTAKTDGFDSQFKSIEEKENWLEKREQAKWDSISW